MLSFLDNRQKRTGWTADRRLGRCISSSSSRCGCSTAGLPIEKKEWLYFAGMSVCLMLGTANVRMAAMRERKQHAESNQTSQREFASMTTRIDTRFAALKAEGRAALVTFLMAGDPGRGDLARDRQGAARRGRRRDRARHAVHRSDGGRAGDPGGRPARAQRRRTTMVKTLALVRDFRKGDDATPIVLMGYYNPIYIYGVDKFLADAKAAGVDGLIIVDLPPEEDEELCLPALKAGLNFIRLATPTTDDKRLPAVLENTSGFVYYVSITGITGAAAPDAGKVNGCGRAHQAPHRAAGRGRLRRARPPSRRARSPKAPTAWWSARRWSMR